MRMLISTASCLCMPKIYRTSSHLRVSVFAVSLSSNTWDGGRSVAAGFVAPGAKAPARPAHAAGANPTILRTGECLACTPAAGEASRKEESRISTQRYAARCHATTWPGGRYVSGHAIGMDGLNTTRSQLHVNIACAGGAKCFHSFANIKWRGYSYHCAFHLCFFILLFFSSAKGSARAAGKPRYHQWSHWSKPPSSGRPLSW